MTLYRFEISFDYDNPGTKIPSKMPFDGGQPPMQGYPMDHQLYVDATDQPVPFFSRERKSHRFVDGDQVYIRLFSTGSVTGEKATPVDRVFYLQSTDSELTKGVTPFRGVLATVENGFAQPTEEFIGDWVPASSREVVRTSDRSPYPCWVVGSAGARAGDDRGRITDFQHHGTGADPKASNTWTFEIWVDISNKATKGPKSRWFVFDPEMVVDPYV